MYLNVAKWLLAPAIAITALSYFSSHPANAKTIFPAAGGAGDRSASLECPKGQYLVGFSGRVGAWIDKIQPICAEVLASGAWGHKTSDMPAKGGRGGTPSRFDCSEGSYISSTKANTISGKQIANVEFKCYTPSNGAFAKDYRRFGGEGAYTPAKEQGCPSGEMAKGMSLRYGQHVNAFGLICAKFNIPKK